MSESSQRWIDEEAEFKRLFAVVLKVSKEARERAWQRYEDADMWEQTAALFYLRAKAAEQEAMNMKKVIKVSQQWTSLLSRTWRGTQSIYHERLIRVADVANTYRVTLKRDTYDHQSYAEVHRWSGKRWELVLRCPLDFLAIKQVSVYAKNIKQVSTHEYTDNMFDADCDALMIEACLITGEGNE